MVLLPDALHFSGDLTANMDCAYGLERAVAGDPRRSPRTLCCRRQVDPVELLEHMFELVRQQFDEAPRVTDGHICGERPRLAFDASRRTSAFTWYERVHVDPHDESGFLRNSTALTPERRRTAPHL